MADSKITALTALTAADPANDMIPIVDVSDTPPASGNTKRISINNLLACSPSATLASATISGDLTVDTSTLKVDSTNDRVGIGTASPTVTLDVVGAARFVAAAAGPKLSIENAGGSTRFKSTDTSSFYYSAYDHNFTNTAGTVDRLVIANSGDVTVSNGNLVMGTSGKGIDFSATANGSGTMTSELLNDYEEGTWTPTAGDAASGGNQATTATAVGRYTKIGRLVTVHFELTDINTTGLTAGNSMNVRGLPFASSSATTQFGTIAGAGITFTGFLTCGVFNGSAFPIYATSTAGALADIKVSGFASGTADIYGTLTYIV